MIYMRTYYSISSKNFYIKIKSPFQIYTLSLHDALPISFWGQSMGSLFLSSRQVNLWFCGCSSDRANRPFFAAIRCLICRQPIISASASKTNRMELEVHFCATVREKAIYWMLVLRAEALFCVPARVPWFC